MTQTILFDPLVPWPVIWAAGAVTLAALLLGLWKGLPGWALRALAALVLLAALSGPVHQSEDRAPLSDIVIVTEDQTASQQLRDRPEQTERARSQLKAALADRPNTDVRWVTVPDGEGDEGTRLMAAVAQALADEPRARVAGIIALSDGQAHDADQPVNLPAPMHLLLTGREDDWDRRLIVKNAPGFAIIGEPVKLTLRIEDQGAVPVQGGFADLEVSVAGGPPQRFALPVGVDFELPMVLQHGGRNVIQFSVPEEPGELTARNNQALVQINGVRDRLRVLLVSGEPHAGGRTWRNLLKSDSAVDLVHFTILRPPEKQDGVPVEELSLIAFPTRELFLEKIEDFDLIIFDRYKRRGILPAVYLDNVANYAMGGGAVLVAAGPDFASADSIYRSPLSLILPAEPSARVLEEAYRPEITNLGKQHPVTSGLEGAADWGRWLRQIELRTPEGHVLMSGAGERPLLVLNRVGEGRVALLASDHAWLWSRGYEGGGPQLELLRRLAHWMMKEPELEEEALWAEVSGQRMRILRRTLAGRVGQVTVTAPDGSTVALELRPSAPGLWETRYEGPEPGLYHLQEGEESTVVGLGPAAPKEFEETIATGSVLAPLLEPLRGGVLRLEDGMPSLRNVRPGRPASGRGWIGLTPREAYETLSVSQGPLLPGWLALLLASFFLLAGWLREGRR
ncbi:MULTISPECIES: membrane protein [unclassified Leisingera]|uniref:membrane protein n=1 Tax=unclassified Leisingera TaxID=2614906 RepID=UPI000317BCDF|nr:MULTISPECIES: membrane protein [unclassified Leisingera]KIC22681.1 membrane protein [Leisingera sp. ANG-S3]KIC51675.1 membrane protein [Leisingera sp. ANG-S]KID08861.1 membrane protein [Leisingera sp. ANG1]